MFDNTVANTPYLDYQDRVLFRCTTNNWKDNTIIAKKGMCSLVVGSIQHSQTNGKLHAIICQQFFTKLN